MVILLSFFRPFCDIFSVQFRPFSCVQISILISLKSLINQLSNGFISVAQLIWPYRFNSKGFIFVGLVLLNNFEIKPITHYVVLNTERTAIFNIIYVYTFIKRLF